jgi:hypothetical protein
MRVSVDAEYPERIAAQLKQFPYGVHEGCKLGGLIDFKVIALQELHTGRWSRHDLVVIEGPFGSLWGVEQETGLTEYQEVDTPFGYGDIEVFKVKAVPTITYAKDDQ